MMFYKNLFAGLCFFSFIIGVLTRSPHALWATMIFGALSRTAVKKHWPDPPFANRLYACIRLQGMKFKRFRRRHRTA